MSDDPPSKGPSENEPNDEPAAASAIRIGNELRPVSGALSVPEDVDWFAISADVDESLEIVVEPSEMLDIRLDVPVPNGAPLVYDNGRRGDPETIPVLKVGAKPQAFAVRSVSSSSGAYTLQFRRRMAQSGLEAEPNDDAQVATEFSVPGEIEGYFDRPDDRDVYRLAGETGAPFEFELPPVRGVRQIARFFDSPDLREPILTVQVGEDVPQRIPNVALRADRPTYLVLSPLGGANRERAYRLRATPHPPVADGVLEVEPNDARPTPLEFAADGGELRVHGYIHGADDKDSFALAPPTASPAGAQPTVEAQVPAALASYAAKARPRTPIGATLTWTEPQSTFGLHWTTAAGDEVEFRREGPDPTVVACGLTLDDGTATLQVRVERLATAPKTGKPQYTVVLTDESRAADWEAEPNDSSGEADILVAARRGALAHPMDVDNYVFSVDAGPDVTVPVEITAEAKSTDLVVRVLDDGGGLVANIDNSAVGSREKMRLDLPAGLYFAEVRWKGGAACVPYEISLTTR